jgi:hypothetical protein
MIMLLARVSDDSADEGGGCSSTGEDRSEVDHTGMSIRGKDQLDTAKERMGILRI